MSLLPSGSMERHIKVRFPGLRRFPGLLCDFFFFFKLTICPLTFPYFEDIQAPPDCGLLTGSDHQAIQVRVGSSQVQNGHSRDRREGDSAVFTLQVWSPNPWGTGAPETLSLKQTGRTTL
jgi:hypothetical protein